MKGYWHELKTRASVGGWPVRGQAMGEPINNILL